MTRPMSKVKELGDREPIAKNMCRAERGENLPGEGGFYPVEISNILK